MGRATKTELLWAYAITREEFLKRVNDKIELHPKEWEDIRNTLSEEMSKGEASIYEPFNEEAFQKLLKDVRSPSYTLTPKRWIETVNAIEIESKRGKNGGTMAHPFIACDFEMWNDMQFQYEMLKYFMSSKVEMDNEENTD